MKILVPIKQVADPDHAGKIRLYPGGLAIDDSHLERKPNPFDEYALEAALRLTEDARNPKLRLGEVIAVSLGGPEVDVVLRSALATGADRAIRVNCADRELDGRIVAKALASLVRTLGVDCVLAGKQSVDHECGEVPQRLAGILDYPQASFCASIREQADGSLEVEQEFDGGVRRLAVMLPAVISVDLRIVLPTSVQSRATPKGHAYPGGVRFASLPAIMQSRRKSIELFELSALLNAPQSPLPVTKFDLTVARGAMREVTTVDALIDCLATHAKVL